MGNQQVSIIAVNAGDIASLNQAKYLLEKLPWKSLGEVEGKAAYKLSDARMWIFPNGILFEDNIDKRWLNCTDEVVKEVIFPSRHAAASGKPSLTLHPIGVPHLDKSEQPKFGGKAGHAPPPSTRLASWWKMLQNNTKNTELANRFELTLEVTHHGPWLEVPAMFIEIGSTEQDWPNTDAAELLSGIIAEGMALNGGASIGLWDPVSNAEELVLVTLGGGHYAPRANKLASLEGVWLGHMLATYACYRLLNQKMKMSHLVELGSRQLIQQLMLQGRLFLTVKSFVPWTKKRSEDGNAKQSETIFTRAFHCLRQNKFSRL